MDTKKIEWDKIKFKMADDYEEFSLDLLYITIYKIDDTFVALVELFGDLNVVGYAIIYGERIFPREIYATYDAKQWHLAKKDYFDILKSESII